VVVYLSSLTQKAGAGPSGDVCIHSGPNKVRCYEALIPGCGLLCRELRTVSLNVSGMKGHARGVPVDISQRILFEHMGIETLVKLSALSDFCIVYSVARSG